MKSGIAKVVGAALVLAAVGRVEAAPRTVNRDAKLHKFSTTIEKERPQLDEETKRLIAAYRRDPSDANRAALRKKIADNYDKIVERKKAKLEELKRTARHESKIEEMQIIVDEMLRDRENRIESSLRRFTDPRLRPGVRDRNRGGYLPVLGAALNVSIAYTPVTNAEFAKFLEATGRRATVIGGEKHPAVNVSYEDAVAYCKWLTEQNNGGAIYRLPTQAEWEAAAGHMPKDADFNCGEHDGTMPVDTYAKTLAACGAIDMWGNVWEWTSTPIDGKGMAVKGGAWDSRRTSCRTEARDEGRAPERGYANVGFRVVREDKGGAEGNGGYDERPRRRGNGGEGRQRRGGYDRERN